MVAFPCQREVHPFECCTIYSAYLVDSSRHQEREAYGLGATILLPKELIEREVNRGLCAGEIALERGCSTALVEYRIKRCHLWRRYTKHEQ
jgi:hypothetical protein